MSSAPDTLYYLASHQWLKLDEDGTGLVGITDFAQSELGDVVYVELPAVGSLVKAGDEVSVVESVKTASEVYAPVSGEVLAVNEALQDTPEILNQSPYEAGWIYRVRLSAPAEVEDLLGAADYLSGTD